MNNYTLTRLIIGVTAIIVVLVFSYQQTFAKKNPLTARFIARTGLFAAMSVILYIVPGLKFSVPFFPSFLELHFDEIPALIAGFAYGPLSGFFVILTKTIVKLPLTTTLTVGEIADFIYSCAFVIPAAFIYKKHKNIKGALISLLAGTIIQVLASSFITSFVMLDFYVFMMGWPKEAILGLCQLANPHVTSLGWTFLFLVALPFNAFKDAIVVIITLLLYKRLHKVIDKIGAQKN